MIALHVRNLHASYGTKAVLRGVDLDLSAGQLLAVLGPSGCGKTTLLRVLAGFMAADSGSIAINGRTLVDDRTKVPSERRKVSIVPQEGALFPHLTVADNVGFGLGRRGDRQERIAAMLDLVGMRGEARSYPNELSGGQQQRVAVARALAPRPEFVLLDEPFSSLDAHLREHLRTEVKGMLRAEGATAILVTHDQQEALSIADEIAVLLDGVICQQGTPRDVYERPASRRVGEFIGDSVVVGATITDKVAHTALGDLPLTNTADDSTEVLLRPEQLQFAANGVPVTVLRCNYFGHDAIITAVLPDGTSITVRTHGDGTMPSAGDILGVRVDGVAHPV